jgi:hypothetical protein
MVPQRTRHKKMAIGKEKRLIKFILSRRFLNDIQFYQLIDVLPNRATSTAINFLIGFGSVDFDPITGNVNRLTEGTHTRAFLDVLIKCERLLWFLHKVNVGNFYSFVKG